MGVNMKKFFKDNYKFLLVFLLIVTLFYLKLPYYIMSPGGTINITDRVELDGYKKINGSINMLYVSEYKATPIMGLYSLLRGYDIRKNEDKKIYDESIEEAEKRSKIMRDNSLDIALMVAYNKAGKYINVKDKKNIVLATMMDNGLKVGDIIIECDEKSVDNIDEIKDIIESKNVNDYVSFKIIRDSKEMNIKSKIYEEDNRNIIGVVIITDYDYDLNPELNLKFRNSESGASGGLMLTLTIYNAITDIDIIKGRNIAGTGTISVDGSVGEIDGVKYKIMGASDNDIDIVFVPEDNYEEALDVKNKYHYDMEIVKVKTFDDALNYLLG